MTFNLKRRKPLSILNFVLILTFFTHGLLYFLYPDRVLDSSFGLKQVKYVIFVIFLLINGCLYKKSLAALFMAWAGAFVLYYLGNESINYLLFLTYMMPTYTLLLDSDLYVSKRLLKAVVSITWVLIIVMSYVEFFFFKNLFALYSDSGYRVVSIFINPNNLSIMLCLYSVYFFSLQIRLLFKFLLVSISFVAVFLTGSRAGLIIFFIMLLIYIYSFIHNGCLRKKISKRGVCDCICIIWVLNIILLFFYDKIARFFSGDFETRTISNIDLKVGRFEQIRLALDNIMNNALFPNFNKIAYVDNLYLSTYLNFGIVIFMLFMALQILLGVKVFRSKDILLKMLYIVFILIGCFENYIYLWPAGYIYWYFIKYCFKDTIIIK